MAKDRVVLVLGATGQQGGATARALIADGWTVRALVRSRSTAKARALAELGVELVEGDLGDAASLAAATRGAYGVFSIQPSSGQPEYGVTDAVEERFGIAVADAARAAGVEHLVYTSVGGLRGGTGVGHFESKWRIEEHVRRLGIGATVVRPVAFMELLLQPHFGLTEGRLTFFMRPDRAMQFIAVEDIGVLVGRIFADRERFAGKTVELAGDELTGNQLAAAIGRATDREIRYAQFPPEVLQVNPVLRRLVEVVDEGLVGGADIATLRREHPALLTFDAWLAKSGAAAIRRETATG